MTVPILDTPSKSLLNGAFAVNDATAIGTLRGASREARLNVPHDIALVGCKGAYLH